MGEKGKEMTVTGWTWRRHIGHNSGKLMISTTYYGALSDQPVTEYFPVLHEGYAGEKAIGQSNSALEGLGRRSVAGRIPKLLPQGVAPVLTDAGQARLGLPA